METNKNARIKAEIENAINEKGITLNTAKKKESLYNEIKKKGLKESEIKPFLRKKLKLDIIPNTTKEIKPPIAIEKKFEKELTKFSEKVNNSVKFWSFSHFNKNFDKNVAKQLSIEFNKLSDYWEKEAKEFGKSLSKRIANYVKKFVNSKFSFENKDFDKRLLSKLEKKQLVAMYERNLSLIKTIPNHILESYRETLLNQVNNFDREALEKQAKTISGISKRRAKTIARDQTQKAVVEYQSARAQALGFEFYVWRTSQDERVSKGKGGHRALNGRIYKYSEPTAIIDSYGNKGHVGERVNCRCVALSLYLNQDEELKLVRDSEAGDYYKIVKKVL